MKCLDRLILCIVSIFSLPFVAGGETLSGLPGMVRMPTAEFHGDGIMTAGISFIPKEVLAYTHYEHDGLTAFSSLTFLPFLEIDLRLTRQLGLPAGANHTVDRSPGLRIRLVKESARTPSVVLGLQDLFTTAAHDVARHFGATYLVVSDIVKISRIHLLPSFGYSFPFYQGNNLEFAGLYGGVKIGDADFNPAICIEYDTQTVNLGVAWGWKNLLQINLALLDGRYFSAGACMQFNLFAVFN